MDRRTYESPMDWEYQNQEGPMDPTSPFVQSTRKTQNTASVFGSPSFGTFGHNQNPFGQSSPQKPLPPTPGQNRSMFNPSHSFSRTNAASPFRNPAFTTPRKSYHAEELSEMSAAESSPAVTDASDVAETPENDSARGLSQMTITPSRSKGLLPKKVPGKGEIASRPIFGGRDRVRKRKKRHDDKDIGGYRLPYKHQEEWEESDAADSDDSTFEPGAQHRGRSSKGWLSNLLSAIQKHPYAPAILGYWLQFAFNLIVVGLVVWVIYIVIGGMRGDYWAARNELRAELLEEMAKCAKDYTMNRCAPIEQRLPAMNKMCEEWEACMNQDPDRVRSIQLGAKNIIEIFNEVFETMHWKTLAVFFGIVLLLCFSGASLSNRGNHPSPAFAPMAHPQPSHGVTHQPALRSPHQHLYGALPATPRHRDLLLYNDETPDTDASPGDYKVLPPPETRSPMRRDRGRSPTKSRSPAKR